METGVTAPSIAAVSKPLEEFSGFIKTAQAGKDIYAVIDAAADEAIYPAITNSGWEYSCLYKKGVHFDGERMTDELASTVPYIIRLDQSNNSLQFVLDRIGKQHLILLKSSSPMKDITAHCSECLRAMDEEGDIISFRYYDPRILRIYIPTCTEEELALFFGPVETFWAEGEENEMLEFSRAPGQMQPDLKQGTSENLTKQKSQGDSLLDMDTGSSKPMTGFGIAGRYYKRK